MPGVTQIRVRNGQQIGFKGFPLAVLAIALLGIAIAAPMIRLVARPPTHDRGLAPRVLTRGGPSVSCQRSRVAPVVATVPE